MDKTHFDQDYTAPRYTQLQIGGASLPLRQPSSRLRNPSHPNSIPGLTLEESIEEHLSPREFLPALPLEPRSPCPVAGHPLPSSLRSSSVAELYHIQSAQLSQNQQVPAPYTLRPVTVAQPQESASNIAHGTRRMVYRTGDIRGAQAIGLTHSRHLSSSSSSGRSNTSTPTRPSPSGSRRELSPHVGAQSLAGIDGLQLSLTSGQSQPSTLNFDYNVPATTTAAPSAHSPGPYSPAANNLSGSFSTITPHAGRTRPRDSDLEADSANPEDASSHQSSIAPGQALVTDHNSNVLARPTKRARTTKSTPNSGHSHQIYSTKPPFQLGHYAGEAYSFVRTFKLISCAILLAKNPFPNPQQRREMLEEAWDKAEQEHPRQGSAAELKLNDDLIRLAADAQRTFRNRVKREAEDAVNDMGEVFGIVPKNTIPKQANDPTGHATAIQNNINVSTQSRANANLIFRQWRDPTQARRGPFKNPAIERVLLMGFRNVEAEGAKAFYLFKDRMPGEAIAFACAAIDVCVEEYSQGTHNRIEFTTHSYRAKWEFYLGEWARLRERDPAAREYTERLQSDLARQAGIACGKISAPSNSQVALPAAITPDDVLE